MFLTSLHVWLKLTARKFLFPKICVVLCKVNNQQHALFRGGKILKAPALCALWLEYYADHSHISAPWPRMNNVASLISIKLINFCTGHCFAKLSHYTLCKKQSLAQSTKSTKFVQKLCELNRSKLM